MSKKGLENFEAFLNYFQEHPEALERLKKLDFTTPQSVIDFGSELGFIFNEQDMAEYAQKALEQKDELSDKDLEKVAGGINNPGAGAAGAVMTLTTTYVAVVIPPVSLAVRK